MKETFLDNVIGALHSSWNSETGYANGPNWNPDNPGRGQCVPSSLIIQDYFGGEIVRFLVTADNIREKHYSNILEGGRIVDTTRSQYTIPVNLDLAPIDLIQAGFSSVREFCLADEETRQRYELLRLRVTLELTSKLNFV